MSAHVWMYWFPAALAVGLSAALLGPARGRAIGVLGGLYWVVLSLSIMEGEECTGLVGVLSLALGAVAIVWVGFWTTSFPQTSARPGRDARPASGKPADDHPDRYSSLLELLTRFDEWLAANEDKTCSWPEFGEFVRSALFRTTGARHVRAYRLPPGTDRLHPLRQIGPEGTDCPSARTGIIGHVVTTGKSYHAGDPSAGKLVAELAATSDQAGAWCFAVRQQRRTVGLIHVGETDSDLLGDRTWMQMLEQIIGLCWTTFSEACGGRLASSTDPVSGVLTREAFMEAANRSLRSSYDQKEPIALVNINIEGLRTLTDNEQWELANEVLYEVSSVLKQRVRQDDQIGVFDGSSFLLLLRRVDSQLAMLIVKQLTYKLTILCGDARRWGVTLTARCGLAGSGVGEPTLRNLVARAAAGCRQAREQDVAIVSDLPQAEEATAV